MLSEDQIARLVQDFYATIIERENTWRLKGQVLTEEVRQARISYYADVVATAKSSLARNQLDDARFVTDAMLRKNGLTDKLDLTERNQASQAILRAAVDLAGHLKARYEGDFNHEPQDKLLRRKIADLNEPDLTTKVEAAEKPTAEPQQEIFSQEPNLSEFAAKFGAAQIKSRTWERQTAQPSEQELRSLRRDQWRSAA